MQFSSIREWIFGPAKRDQRPLIFDIGVNHGEDSLYYLQKGFRVIGLEANPLLVAELRQQFAPYLESGQFQLLNEGIWGEPTQLTFYLNEECDHWSSFDPAYGCRNGTRFSEVPINCRTIASMFEEFGVPYYAKIDVEGADKMILQSMAAIKSRPAYISVEEYGIGAIEHLAALGYRRFQIAPQNPKLINHSVEPPLEGSFVPRTFLHTDSGQFGRELPGEWLDYDAAREAFHATVRSKDGHWLGIGDQWFDIHATEPT